MNAEAPKVQAPTIAKILMEGSLIVSGVDKYGGVSVDGNREMVDGDGSDGIINAWRGAETLGPGPRSAARLCEKTQINHIALNGGLC